MKNAEKEKLGYPVVSLGTQHGFISGMVAPGHIVFWAIAVLFFIGFSGCKRGQSNLMQQENSSLEQDSIPSVVTYAKGFRFEKTSGGNLLILLDPLHKGREIARYRLLPAGSKMEPMNGCVDLLVPVKQIVASSTTHAGFLSAIGAGVNLMGCNNPERLYDSVLYSRYQLGELFRTGRDLSYNLEFLITAKPGLVLQTGIDEQFTPDARLTGIGIPVLFILEWMESTPLGRAEWIKVFGQITGKADVADSLFRIISQDYHALAALGSGSPEKVKVLTGNVFKGTWYMPGGKNYMTRFFEDAGMDYLWKDTDQTASLALSFESVIYKLSDAPVWISVNVDSLSQLLQAESRYSRFRAVQEQRVFSILNRINNHGGNDFWEGAVVRPDRVLADLLTIAHPKLMPDHVWYYFKPLVYK